MTQHHIPELGPSGECRRTSLRSRELLRLLVLLSATYGLPRVIVEVRKVVGFLRRLATAPPAVVS